MPVQLSRSKQSGAILMRHPCDVCGKNAPFGFNVHMKRVFDLKDKKKNLLAENLLSKQRWYCGEHKQKGENSH